MRLRIALAALAAVVLTGALSFQPAVAAEKAKAGAAESAKAAVPCPALKPLDPDNDGTLDLAEAKAAAATTFAKLNKDSKKDDTLDLKELQGRVSKKELEAANPDNDGTLDSAEYLALVEKRFAAANPDADGTLDCKELHSKAGKALLKLLK